MPFAKEREERLNELFDLIEQNGDVAVHEPTYLAVPYLKETCLLYTSPSPRDLG